MDRMLIVFIGIFFLVLGAFGIALFADQIDRQVRATNPPDPASENSIMLSSTQQPVSIGEEININAIARSIDNEPVPGAEICLSSSVGTITPPCAESDEAGITSHIITSSEAGIANIQGVINGSVPIGTNVTAEFTQ